MNSGISKPRCSRVRLRKPLQQELLNAIAKSRISAQFPLNSTQRPSATSQDTTYQPKKRQFDEACELEFVPSKRTRVTQVEASKPRLRDLEEQGTQTILHQPQPKPTNEPYASFLADFVDHPFPTPFAFVSKWLESIGSERDEHCRSDSCIHALDDNGTISRRLTKSAPAMASTRDADGFALPPTPTSCHLSDVTWAPKTGSIAPTDCTGATPTSWRASGKSLVEDPLYRDTNLALNHIYMRSSREQFPEHVSSLIAQVRKDRDSPGPSHEEVWKDRSLEALGEGAGEPDVEKYFHTKIFPDYGPDDNLKRNERTLMAKHTVPSAHSKHKVSTPVPDMLYGYNRYTAFAQQQTQLASMANEMVANNSGLLYPFFVIEFKGDGPSGSGSLWVATNQCLGASASCVKIAERLNEQLRVCELDEIQPVDSTAFSIAMNGTVARLYVSWKHSELGYYMANVDSFLLQKPADYLQFRTCVRNIIDWGKDTRLMSIQDCLDALLDEGRKRTSEAAKSRPPPSSGSATSSGKKRKSVPSGSSSVSNNIQRQSSASGDSYWKWDLTYQRHYHQHSNGTIEWAKEEA